MYSAFSRPQLSFISPHYYSFPREKKCDEQYYNMVHSYCDSESSDVIMDPVLENQNGRVGKEEICIYYSLSLLKRQRIMEKICIIQNIPVTYKAA